MLRPAHALLGLGCLVCCSLLGPSRAAAKSDDPFQVIEVPSSGRTVSSEIADFDGDGRTDLLQVVFNGLPPAEERELRVWFQRDDGRLGDAPDIVSPVPTSSAAYEVADVLEAPGRELLLLRPTGVRLVSFRRGAPGGGPGRVEVRDVVIPRGTTMGAAQDERGLDRLRLSSFQFGDRPVLIVPALGTTYLFAPEGELIASFDVGGRANFFLQPRGPIMAESDVQLFFDAPRISVGDVNGDGRPDVVATARHDLRVFLRREDGGYPSSADRLIPLDRIPEADHIRGSGSVRCEVRDLDGDGLVDLFLSETKGGITDSRTESAIYLNSGDGWSLDSPDAVFKEDNALSADELIDLDGDGQLELMRAEITIGVFDIIEFFITRSMDVVVKVYGKSEDGGIFSSKWFQQQFEIPVNFDTSRLYGFMPTVDFDINADGKKDFLSSADGNAVEVFIGRGRKHYGKRTAYQKVDTEGMVNPGDWNGDGLLDLVLFNPRRRDVPVRLLVNRGVLPGTPPSIGPRDP